MCAAAVVEGVGLVTLGIPLLAFFIVSASMGLSLILARLGVARPDLDVFHVIIRRPGHPERELPGISAGASIVQAILNILTLPTVKVFRPRSSITRDGTFAQCARLVSARRQCSAASRCSPGEATSAGALVRAEPRAGLSRAPHSHRSISGCSNS
jgi:hypothetical protein